MHHSLKVLEGVLRALDGVLKTTKLKYSDK